MEPTEKGIIEDIRDTQKAVLLRSVLHRLERSVELQGVSPDTSIAGVMAKLTNDSASLIAPLVEAVFILEEIIYASDGCNGHRLCQHSMEPWQRARALLHGKWQAYEDRTEWPAVAALPVTAIDRKS